jgi:hypothetical protein
MYEDEESKINMRAIIFVLALIAVVEFFITTIHVKHEPEIIQPESVADQNKPFVSKIIPLDENGQELAPYSDNHQVDQETKK